MHWRGAAVVVLVGAGATAEPGFHGLEIDSGWVTGTGATRGAVHRLRVTQPGAAWLRLTFDGVVLGQPPPGARPTLLRLSGVRDGAVQHHDAATLRQWARTSAYFNGDAVIVELIADPGAGPSRVVVAGAWADSSGGASATICGRDDREPSGDPRVGRVMPALCSAWLVGPQCLLSAGHCAPGAGTIIEFNVPPSDAQGNEQHPAPQDQYAVDPDSVQLQSAFLGNDWAYFGCFANGETGLAPGTAQGDWHELAPALPSPAGQPLRVTGFGLDDAPPEANRTQQRATGPYRSGAGTLLQYQVDTAAGNSGSPVLEERSGLALGIHTHGGCDAMGGANYGTSVEHPGLQAALARPRGVCAAACPADVDGDSQVNVADLVLVLLAWGGADEAADTNGDGVVDVLDLTTVVLAWGACA